MFDCTRIAAKLLVRADQEYMLNAEALGLKETTIDGRAKDAVTEGQIRIVKLRKDNGLPLVYCSFIIGWLNI